MLLKVVAYLQKKSPHLSFAAAPSSGSLSNLMTQGLALGCATVATCGLGVFLATGATSTTGGRAPALAPPHTQDEAFIAACGAFDRDQPTRVTMISSPEKRAWIEDVYGRFARLCPNIQVELHHLEDEAAIRLMLASGSNLPTLWSPASSDALSLFAARWTGAQVQPFELEAARPLAMTPIVLVLASDQARRLLRQDDEHRPRAAQGGLWANAGCARAPEGGDPDHVWFVHPHPLRSSVGLSSIAMIADDLARGPSSTQGDDRDHHDHLRDWFRRCAPAAEHLKHSPRDLTYRLAGGQFPGLATSERYAIEFLSERSRDPELPIEYTVVYPETTILHDHPVVGRTSEASDAAERWVEFLRGEESQARAVELGLRPADGGSVRTDLDAGDNPFLRLRRQGLAPELPSIPAPPRSAADTAALMQAWSDALGTS